jgi:hypothetical protein
VTEEKAKMICGIVMPISAIDGCTESHWSDVLDILSETIEEAGFEANLVSNADDVGIIHKRIIQNLYDNPIVVCDVSGKNPNVMFELGLRLAFDKPTIIVKDDKTSYSFDTSAIEHLEYPRDLRFTRIIEFKQKLLDKIVATYEKSTSDSSYTTFLKHFGEFKVAKLDKKEVSGQEFILEELKNIRFMMRRLERNQIVRDVDFESSNARSQRITGDIDICMGGQSEETITEACKVASGHPDVREVLIDDRGRDHKHLIVNLKPGANTDVLELEKMLGGRARRRRPPSNKAVAKG